MWRSDQSDYDDQPEMTAEEEAEEFFIEWLTAWHEDFWSDEWLTAEIVTAEGI